MALTRKRATLPKGVVYKGGNLYRAIRGTKALNGTVAQVGWFSNSPHPNGRGLTTPQVAKYLEEGTSRQPARPMLRTAGKISEKSRKNLAQRLKRKLLKGEITAEEFARSMGTELKDNLEMVMLESLSFGMAQNSPSTTKQKGFNLPGIESGHLFDSIEVKIKHEHMDT